MGWTDREDGEWQSIGDLLGFASWRAVEDTTPPLQTVDSNTFTIWIYIYIPPLDSRNFNPGFVAILSVSLDVFLVNSTIWRRAYSAGRGVSPVSRAHSRDSTVPFNTAEVAAHMILLHLPIHLQLHFVSLVSPGLSTSQTLAEHNGRHQVQAIIHPVLATAK